MLRYVRLVHGISAYSELRKDLFSLARDLITPGKLHWRRYTGHASPSLKITMPGAARGGSWWLLGGSLLISSLNLLCTRKKDWIFVAALDFFVIYAIFLLYIDRDLPRSVFLFDQPSKDKRAVKRSWRGSCNPVNWFVIENDNAIGILFLTKQYLYSVVV